MNINEHHVIATNGNLTYLLAFFYSHYLGERIVPTTYVISLSGVV